MKTLAIIPLVLIVLVIIPQGLNAQNDVRTSRSSITAHANSGVISGDPAAILSLEVDYGLLNRLSLGINYAYIDGYLLQKHTIGLFAKGYALDWVLDIYGGAGINIYTNENNEPAVIPNIRCGVEWQTPIKIVIGLEATYLLQKGNPGFLKGGFAGIRF